MSNTENTGDAGRSSLRLAGNASETERPRPTLPRQFVNFTFYRARPEWRMLDEAEKASAKQDYLKVLDEFRGEMLIHTYSLVGLRTNAEMMIWRIGYALDPFQEMTTLLNRTRLGQYLEATQSFLSMTKRSMYIDKDILSTSKTVCTSFLAGPAISSSIPSSRRATGTRARRSSGRR